MPITVTAAGTSAPRSLPNRFADWLNVRDFGASLDGIHSDNAAFTATLQAVAADQPIFIPYGGAANITWATIGNVGPSTPVHWLVDGTQAGGAPITQAFSRTGTGDLFETFHNGTKYLMQSDAAPDMYGALRVEYGHNSGAGTGGSVCTPIRVNATDWTGANTSMWGVHVAMNSYSDQPAWPQNVGVSSSLLKYGQAWCAGMHITASDMQNLPSSTGGTLLGMEIGYHTNGVDDTFNGSAYGNTGTRMGVHLSLSEQNGSGLLPAEISFGILADGSSNAIVKSVYALSNSLHGYQAFDARGAVVPSGYTDPYAAVRMTAGQIIDFNGGPNLNSAAGNYLQYTKAGTTRLRYMVSSSEIFSIADNGLLSISGNLSITGGVFARSGSAAPTTAQVPAGTYTVWKNTADSTVKLYYNDAGTLRSVSLT